MSMMVSNYGVWFQRPIGAGSVDVARIYSSSYVCLGLGMLVCREALVVVAFDQVGV